MVPSDHALPLSLLIVSESGTTLVPLSGGEPVTLGRSRESAIPVDDSSVSRTHARIGFGPGEGAWIEDLGSSNGTIVLGRKLEPKVRAPVPLGAAIELGTAVIVLQSTLHAGSLPKMETTKIALEKPPGGDPTMHRLYALLDVIGRSPLNVVILGEPGTGKGIFAEALHARSDRASDRLLKIDCAATPAGLLPQALFGYEKGALPEAHQARRGLLETANGGTVFLGEVGALAREVQERLLSALTLGRIVRIGGSEARAIDVRCIASTSRDLPRMLAEGTFSAGLHEKLNGFSVTLPPLRERRADITSLGRVFLERNARRLNVPPPELSPEASEVLLEHTWPGNVRELRNVLGRALVLARGAPTIAASHVVFADEASTGITMMVRSGDGGAAGAGDERARIDQALAESAGNQGEAAKRLGISRSTLIRRLEEFGISRPRKRE